MPSITSIVYTRVEPARGAGAIHIAAKYGSQSDASLSLFTAEYSESAHEPFAKTLSEKLSVPLEIEVSLDA